MYTARTGIFGNLRRISASDSMARSIWLKLCGACPNPARPDSDVVKLATYYSPDTLHLSRCRRCVKCADNIAKHVPLAGWTGTIQWICSADLHMTWHPGLWGCCNRAHLAPRHLGCCFPAARTIISIGSSAHLQVQRTLHGSIQPCLGSLQLPCCALRVSKIFCVSCTWHDVFAKQQASTDCHGVPAHAVSQEDAAARLCIALHCLLRRCDV